jgi:hypothetical protein
MRSGLTTSRLIVGSLTGDLPSTSYSLLSRDKVIRLKINKGVMFFVSINSIQSVVKGYNFLIQIFVTPLLIQTRALIPT